MGNKTYYCLVPILIGVCLFSSSGLLDAEITENQNKDVNSLSSVLSKNNKNNVQLGALESLGNIKTAESAEALIFYFQHTHKFPNEVTDALSNIGKPAIQPIVKEFEGNDNYTRAVLLGALNEMTGELLTDEKAIKEIKALFVRAFLKDNSTLVRGTALHFLWQFTYDDAEVMKLVRAAENDKDEKIRRIASDLLNRQTVPEKQ
jgi:HEAT repeat protein